MAPGIVLCSRSPGAALSQLHVHQHAPQFLFFRGGQLLDGVQALAHGDALEGQALLDHFGEGAHGAGDAQRRQAELGLQGALPVAVHVLVVDVRHHPGRHVGAAGHSAGAAVVQAGVDHSVPAHDDLEVVPHVGGQPQVLAAVGHVAAGVLDADDVAAVMGQAGRRGRGDVHVGFGGVVVHQHRHGGALGDGAVVGVELFLGLADEHGSQHADGVVAAHLLHQFDQPDDLPGGDVAAARQQLDGPATAGGLVRDGVPHRFQPLDVFVVVQGVELAGGAKGEQAVHAAVHQKNRHPGHGSKIHMALGVKGGDEGGNDTIGFIHSRSLL